MRNFTNVVLLLIGVGALTGAGSAKDVPVYVYWSGTEPTAAYVSVPGGVEPLKKNAADSVFLGTMSLPSDAPQRRTITMRYGRYLHPFDILVQPVWPRVSFTVEHLEQRSCTRSKVDAANAPTDNLLDAIKRSVNAGELLKIEEPNACDANLKFATTQAKFRQSVAMNKLSNGMFLVNRQIVDDYLAAARARGTRVDAEVASLEQWERHSEVRQLLAIRLAAEGTRNYSSAIQVTDYMKSRLNSGVATAAIYKGQGLTEGQLEIDAERLAALETFGVPGTPGRTGYVVLTSGEKRCRQVNNCPLDSRMPCPPC